MKTAISIAPVNRKMFTGAKFFVRANPFAYRASYLHVFVYIFFL